MHADQHCASSYANCPYILFSFALEFNLKTYCAFFSPAIHHHSVILWHHTLTHPQCDSVCTWAQCLVEAVQGQSRLNSYLSLCGNQCNPEYRQWLIQNRLMLSVSVRGWKALLIRALLIWSPYRRRQIKVHLCDANEYKEAQFKAPKALINDDGYSSFSVNLVSIITLEEICELKGIRAGNLTEKLDKYARMCVWPVNCHSFPD